MTADFYSRTEALLGKEAVLKLKNARIAVFGAGGVGSAAIEALARSGVGSIDIFDHDTISPSNLNRQLMTDSTNIGKEKAAEAAAPPLNLSRFRKPTGEEVAGYCRTRGNNVDAERFWNFYESQGWRVGKNPMKDWQAAVRTWEKREEQDRQAKQYSHERTTATSREQRLAEARRAIVADIEQNERTYATPTDIGEVYPEELFGGV